MEMAIQFEGLRVPISLKIWWFGQSLNPSLASCFSRFRFRFCPNPTDVVHCVKRVIQSKFDEPWPTWKQVPIGVRNMWFGEFKRYHWLLEREHQMRKNFETCGMNRLKGIFCQARKKLDIRPLWLSPEVWSELLVYWKSEEFKARSAQANENKASEDVIGSSLHTGGSIPTSEHKRRLRRNQLWFSLLHQYMASLEQKESPSSNLGHQSSNHQPLLCAIN